MVLSALNIHKPWHLAPRYYKGGGNVPTTHILTIHHEGGEALGHVQVIEKEDDDELDLTAKSRPSPIQTARFEVGWQVGVPRWFLGWDTWGILDTRAL